jgi:protein associated with RNAse G/E
MKYPPFVVERVQLAVQEVLEWVRARRGPFRTGFVERWYDRYLMMREDAE